MQQVNRWLKFESGSGEDRLKSEGVEKTYEEASVPDFLIRIERRFRCEVFGNQLSNRCYGIRWNL